MPRIAKQPAAITEPEPPEPMEDLASDAQPTTAAHMAYAKTAHAVAQELHAEIFSHHGSSLVLQKGDIRVAVNLDNYGNVDELVATLRAAGL